MTNKKLSKKTGQKSKKVGQKSKFARQKLLEYFYENPLAEATVRELAIKTKLSRSTVQYWLQQFKQEGIISGKNQWFNSSFNRLVKSCYYQEKIVHSGLIDYLEKELAATAIILFGSFNKGESVQESDIDFFVECAREKKLDLRKFERKLGHSVDVFTRPKITLLPKRLLNNVVNGIKLRGYFTIK